MGFKIREYRCKLVKARDITLPLYVESLDNVDIAIKLAKAMTDNWPSERLLSIMVNSATKITGVEIISHGGLNGTSAYVREILRAAIISNSSGFILAHNHPSGNPEPSDDDLRMIDTTNSIGMVMGVHLIDFIIVTAFGGNWSAVENNKL